jgi:hypothetical protein
MKKQLIILGIVAILICVGLSGCNQGDNSSNNQGNNSNANERIKFIGTWVNISTKGIVTAINLFSDNTSAINTLPGNWIFTDGKLVITLVNKNQTSVLFFNYVFSNNNSTLLLTSTEGGGAQIFTKRYNPSNAEKNTFVGTWVNISTIGTVTTMNLFSNGTSVLNKMPGTWDVKDGKLVIRFDAFSASWVYNFIFSDNDNTLSLTSTMGGITQVFTKT